jgi:SAM-dependent methyltransferase
MKGSMGSSADVQILDIGCGGGRRLLEFLEFADLAKAGGVGPVVKIEGCDRDATWETHFEATLLKYGAKFCAGAPTEVNGKYSLIHLSHVLYDPGTVLSLAKCLRGCKEDVLVVVRGCTANSFFTHTSRALESQMFPTGFSHLWDSIHLQHLVNVLHLRRVDAKKGPREPDFIIKQEYELNPGSILAAERLLEYLYGKSGGSYVRDLLERLRTADQAVSVPNHDAYFLYRTTKPA